MNDPDLASLRARNEELAHKIRAHGIKDAHICVPVFLHERWWDSFEWYVWASEENALRRSVRINDDFLDALDKGHSLADANGDPQLAPKP